MPVCVTKKIEKVRLCTGDKQDKIAIVTRSIGAPTVGTVSPSTTFTTLLEPWAAVETLGLSGSSTRRFDSINIEDRPTHIMSIDYDDSIWPLDSDNVFVQFDSRNFRIVGVTDLNEMKTTIELLCKERGISSKEAAKA